MKIYEPMLSDVNIAGPANQIPLERLVRDALASLFDPAALATHPLTDIIGEAGDAGTTKGDQLRNILLDIVQQLRPQGDAEADACSPEWRPFLVLQGRYVDGDSLQSLQDCLALSERQLRREHSRAIRAVAAILQDSYLSSQPDAETPESSQLGDYSVTAVSLDAMEMLRGVVATMQTRAEREGTRILIVPSAPARRVLADRVIVRQVLVTMLGHVLEARRSGPITIRVESKGTRVLLRVGFRTPSSQEIIASDASGIGRAAYWCEQMGASITERSEGPEQHEFTLDLPTADEPVVLVVDDQETAIRLFQRYMSNTGYRVVGLRDGTEALSVARQVRPMAITLDVMMPHTDGWEVLQSLQADPDTRHIPVIVCSVWEEPDLAMSLGATAFLNKPIKREDLLSAIEALCLQSTEVAKSAEGSEELPPSHRA